jgi:hypothetical protein
VDHKNKNSSQPDFSGTVTTSLLALVVVGEPATSSAPLAQEFNTSHRTNLFKLEDIHCKDNNAMYVNSYNAASYLGKMMSRHKYLTNDAYNFNATSQGNMMNNATFLQDNMMYRNECEAYDQSLVKLEDIRGENNNYMYVHTLNDTSQLNKMMYRNKCYLFPVPSQ